MYTQVPWYIRLLLCFFSFGSVNLEQHMAQAAKQKLSTILQTLFYTCMCIDPCKMIKYVQFSDLVFFNAQLFQEYSYFQIILYFRDACLEGEGLILIFQNTTCQSQLSVEENIALTTPFYEGLDASPWVNHDDSFALFLQGLSMCLSDHWQVHKKCNSYQT